MQEGQLLMSQADKELAGSTRQSLEKVDYAAGGSRIIRAERAPVKRLIDALNKHGDKAVVHGLPGKLSSRKIAEKVLSKRSRCCRPRST
jgi:hypothetical protein